MKDFLGTLAIVVVTCALTGFAAITYLTNFDPGLCVQPAPLCARVKPLLTRDPAQLPEGFTLDERPRNP